MGGIVWSDFERDVDSEASWTVEHHGLGSPWSQFSLRRYGVGFGATGVSASVALPRLLRRRLQDWAVQGLGVHLGPNFISFGRQLESVSRSEAQLFYGVDIFFGDTCDRASWFWYCRASEWLLQLHKAVLEPLPTPPPMAPTAVQGARGPLAGDAGHRWPGRPRFLGDTAQARAAAEAAAAAEAEEALKAATLIGKSKAEEDPDVDELAQLNEIVDQQLSLFLSNADGHIGCLSLPVPRSQAEVTARLVEQWGLTCEVPLLWAGRDWTTEEDFMQLRETALNMPDLMLLGLETELCMTLTPDWTWEKYPRGYGDAALPGQQGEDSQQ